MASTVTELLRRRFGGKKAPQITYIENPSTAYIDTGIILADTDTFELDFEWVQIDGFLSGANASNGEHLFFMYNTFVQWETRVTPGWVANTRYNISINNEKLVKNGVDYVFSGTPYIDMNVSTKLCCANTSGYYPTSPLDSRRAKIKIYSFGIKDSNGNYRFKGKPALVNGRYGLKDSVSGNFFGSASDVEFIGG